MRSPAGIVERSSGDDIRLVIQESVYSLEALFKTCYLFTDRCYLLLRRLDKDSIEVHITPKDKSTLVEGLVGKFGNELIDQRVRADVARESGKIREIIVAQAFAEGNLLDTLDAVEGHDDYNRDPFGIGDSSEHKNP